MKVHDPCQVEAAEPRSRGPIVKSYAHFELSSNWHPQPTPCVAQESTVFSFLYLLCQFCAQHLRVKATQDKSHCPLDAYILMDADRQTTK